MVSQRYKRITRAVNLEFWGNDSESNHSLYVGSYGRGTAIDTSDIDMLVELPKDEYERFDTLKGNGQSRLLQTVKKAILTTYPRSNVRGDGQVVVIEFSDGIRFEVLPAFRQIDSTGNWNGQYTYPDSNMGGNWLTTNPKAEQQAMRKKNIESNGLLYDTCKHMREIRDKYFRSYHLPGIVIDTFVYHYISNWHWLREGEQYSNQPTGTYEKKLYLDCSTSPFWGIFLTAPGSGMSVNTTEYTSILTKVLNYMANE